ncbi:Uncharacterized protein Rs2_14806 [Raphanus sativus]|nr:Uncharacterized protein Rs2_14806 [Raphanus sativus]
MRATPKVEIWKSPIPYLFGGLSLVLFLIALALFSLVCIHRKSHSSSSNNTYNVEEEEDAGDNEAKTVMGEYLPKIVVILAGDDQPTCLAVPVIPTLSSIYPCVRLARECACQHRRHHLFPSSSCFLVAPPWYDLWYNVFSILLAYVFYENLWFSLLLTGKVDAVHVSAGDGILTRWRRKSGSQWDCFGSVICVYSLMVQWRVLVVVSLGVEPLELAGVGELSSQTLQGVGVVYGSGVAVFLVSHSVGFPLLGSSSFHHWLGLSAASRCVELWFMVCTGLFLPFQRSDKLRVTFSVLEGGN